MIQFKIHFNTKIGRALYEDYCRFIFDSVKQTIHKSIDNRKYKVREKAILESSVIQWDGRPPRHIDLIYYVENCLVMTKEYGEFLIHLDESKVIPNSSTKVSTLIRLLEYGNELIPPYPLVSQVILYFSQAYPNLLLQFMKARMIKRESVSVRRSTRRKIEEGPQ